jgi:hypothetical protein
MSDPKALARLAALESKLTNLERKAKDAEAKIARLEQLLRQLGMNPDVVRS